MRLFACPVCEATVHFANSLCTNCGAEIGFAPGAMRMLAPDPDGTATLDGHAWQKCAHYARLMGCNWMVADGQTFCVSCRLNNTIPDLSDPWNLTQWRRLEDEKRRLIYAALRLGLPVAPMDEDPDGLAFDFLADRAPSFTETGRVMTGHSAGLITINIAEADPVARERMRAQMAEPYRTILGHLRHESGHYYWDRLVRDGPLLGPFRELFGDDSQDYGDALARHYAGGPPPDWPQAFVSAYASAHPWEDWAESWNHYLLMLDTLETAWAFGLGLDPRGRAAQGLAADADRDPYRSAPFDALVAQWLPLTVAINALNTSMGHEPAYPFALGAAALRKLAFVHAVVHATPPPVP